MTMGLLSTITVSLINIFSNDGHLAINMFANVSNRHGHNPNLMATRAFVKEGNDDVFHFTWASYYCSTYT